MAVVVIIIELTICIFSMSLHAIGLYILHTLKGSNTINGSQRIFLFNLSLSEFSVMSCEPIKAVLKFHHQHRLKEFVTIIQLAGFSLVYYFSMVYLTADRFFEMYLNLKYHLYWNELSTRYLMWSVWFICCLVNVVCCLLYEYEDVNIIRVCYIYIFPICELIFIIVALITYTYVIKIAFIMFRKRRRIGVVVNQVVYNDQLSQISTCNSTVSTTTTTTTQHRMKKRVMFREPAFYVPTLLIMTFIVFMVIPDLIYLFAVLNFISITEEFRAGIFMTYFVSFTCDAVIYIFLSPPVRKTLLKKLSNICSKCQ